jgi:hypothetical protein
VAHEPTSDDRPATPSEGAQDALRSVLAALASKSESSFHPSSKPRRLGFISINDFLVSVVVGLINGRNNYAGPETRLGANQGKKGRP